MQQPQPASAGIWLFTSLVIGFLLVLMYAPLAKDFIAKPEAHARTYEQSVPITPTKVGF